MNSEVPFKYQGRDGLQENYLKDIREGFLVDGPAPERVKSKSNFRVVQWNINCLEWRPRELCDQEDHVENVMKVLLELEAEIIVLQEFSDDPLGFVCFFYSCKLKERVPRESIEREYREREREYRERERERKRNVPRSNPSMVPNFLSFFRRPGSAPPAIIQTPEYQSHLLAEWLRFVSIGMDSVGSLSWCSWSTPTSLAVGRGWLLSGRKSSQLVHTDCHSFASSRRRFDLTGGDEGGHCHSGEPFKRG